MTTIRLTRREIQNLRDTRARAKQAVSKTKQLLEATSTRLATATVRQQEMQPQTAVRHKDVTVTLTARQMQAELQRRRHLLKISDAVWQVLQYEKDDQQLFDFVNQALQLEGRQDVLTGEFSRMWGTYIPKGTSK